MDEKGDPSNEEAPKVIKPTSKEFRKTWGFRRTTIAKREGAGDAEVDSVEQQPQQQQQSLSLRRSGRQPKRTERVEEFLTTVRRRGRRTLPVSPEDPSEPASCPLTDVETASEGSVESAPDSRGGPRAGVRECSGSSAKAGKGGDDEDDTSDSDSDGLTLKELQNRLRRKREQEPADRPLKGALSRLRKKRREEDLADGVDMEAADVAASSPPGQQEPVAEAAASNGRERTSEGRATLGPREEGPRSAGKRKPEGEAYDPGTLYCLCRQPHNSRFMICCDRCEEWFHGDCVGISEARGRLLERNGEDYICPNCTVLQVQDEPSSEVAGPQEARLQPADLDSVGCTSMGTVEQRSSEDQGIKGRIEKAANPSGKKKLKIFQPVAEPPVTARCIGPGCSRVAQPDSVYCSSDCILKHAAATMKFLNAGREAKAKPKDKAKAKPERLILPKCSVQAGVRVSSVHKRAAPDKRESTVTRAVTVPARSEALVKEAPCESGTPSWASDHNYNAVKPEQPAAPRPSLLCKSVKEDRLVEESAVAAGPKKVAALIPATGSRQPSPRRLLPKKSPPFANTVKPAVRKLPSGFTGTIPKRPWPSAAPSGSAAPTKQAGLGPGAAVAASKKLPCSPTLGGVARKPTVASAPLASPAPGHLGASNTAPLQPNSQIRQNIRRSLKEILWKRASDSDDLTMTESEVGKVAFHIEKEMFSLFRVTDNRYKSKYRSIMFNLKDPKNQGLFHRVLREEIPLAKLVRMKPEELVSKELSVWKEQPAKPVPEPRAKSHPESKKVPARPETIPDMEDSPPVSDSEEQESVRTIPEKSAAPPLDVVSSMLKDTTGQHRAHLFDLNCRICTGQVSSEGDLAPKRQKLSAPAKKEEPRPKHDGAPSEPALGSANEGVPETLPKSASAVEPESMAPAPSERGLPGAPRDGHPEPSAPEGPPCPAPGGAAVVTTVTVSGRDPRTAQSTALTPDSTPLAEPLQDVLKPPVLMPKSILAKPAPSPEPRYLLSVPASPSISAAESRSPPDGDAPLFLSRLSTIWKGFINMQSVAKFVTKAYPVSGCFDYLSEDLPDTIHIGGRIAPRTVWDYIGKLKSSVSKELCLIRFHPATEEEEVAYISLYSYFSSRGRFGVVANNSRHIKDLYLIPLSAEDPVPSKLLPFEGPGLESPRPNIILGLVICQKMKRPSTAGEVEEKRARLQAPEDMDTAGYPRVPPASQSEKKPPKYQLSSGDTAISGTPPASPPPPPPLPELPASSLSSSSSSSSSSVSKTLASLKPGSAGTVMAPAAPAAVMAAAASASKTASPLEHILQTLFGKKKAFDPAATEPVDPTPAARPEARAEGGLPAAPLLDPIVQQFGQLSRERALEEEEDDRPYDPEEEYGPDRALDAQLGGRGKRPGAERASETTEREEVAYDPEDETILEEAKVTVEDLPNRMCADTRGGGAAAPSLAEQQQMIEELNRQIEEQKRQVQEQEEALRQQRAAVGASMAHFSVSDALMSPPPKAVLPKAELFLQEPPAASRAAGPPSGQGPGPSSDPRQNRDPRQARRLAAESSESESSKAPASSTPGALPSRDMPGGATVGQGPVPTPEEKEPSPPAWAPRDEASRPAKQEGPLGEPSESRGPPPPANGGPPMAGGPGPARPARKVLLPTPPSAAFPPGFPAQSEGQGFGSPAARDPFVSPAFASQDRAFCSSSYEDLRNTPFAEKCNRSATETEGDRDTQGRPGEGAATCPPPGQATCPPPGPQCQGQREPAPRSFGMSGLHGPNFPGPRGPAPPFSEENVISNNDGLRGPPPARFGAQKGPIPSLFSGPHGPPPYGDARGPSPSHPGGPRAAAPPPFEERKDLHGGPRELQDAPYGDVAGTPGPFEGLEQGPSGGSRGPGPFPFGGPRRPLLAPFKGPRGGPPPSQFGGQRGPPPGHFVGPRGPHPSQFDGPRGQAANFMPGPRGLQPQQFDEQRVNSPPRFANQRAPAPLQFGGPRGPIPFPDKSEPAPPRFHFQGPGPQGVKPVPRPLLELPSHPPQHRKDRWDEVGPAPTLPSGTPGSGPEAEAQWAPPDFREGKAPEYRNQAGPKEKPPEEPETQAESRQGRAFEDRRRERERGRNWSRERDWDRGREWDRHREKDSCRDRNRDRERDWERGRERSRNRDRRLRDRERSRSRDRDRDRARERERGRDRRDRSKSKEDVRDPKAETSVPRAADPTPHT